MKPLLLNVVFILLFADCFSQVEVRSTNSERMQQQAVKKLAISMGFGGGYNHMQTQKENFGFELFIAIPVEAVFYERVKTGVVVAASLAGINQTVLLNDGSRFDTDRAPTGGFFWPYAAIIVYKSNRLTIAPQVGYKWHFFSSENIDLPEPVQAFSSRGFDYAIIVDYATKKMLEIPRKRMVRMVLNYSQLKINGQPSSVQMYGAGFYLTMGMFNKGSRS